MAAPGPFFSSEFHFPAGTPARWQDVQVVVGVPQPPYPLTQAYAANIYVLTLLDATSSRSRWRQHCFLSPAGRWLPSLCVLSWPLWVLDVRLRRDGGGGEG